MKIMYLYTQFDKKTQLKSTPANSLSYFPYNIIIQLKLIYSYFYVFWMNNNNYYY